MRGARCFAVSIDVERALGDERVHMRMEVCCEALGQAIIQRDAWALAGAVLDVFLSNVDNIGFWIWQQASNDATRSFLAATHGILKNTAVVMKVFFAAETGINRAAPYFWDLVTAPAVLSYTIQQSGGVLEQNDRNEPPREPRMTAGPSTAITGTGVTFMATCSDPDADRIRYRFHWGDGTADDWTGFIPSGASAEASHTFAEEGVFGIIVEVRDERGASASTQEAFRVYVVRDGFVMFDNFDDDLVGGLPTSPPWDESSELPSYVSITDRAFAGATGRSVSFVDFDEDVGETEGAAASIVGALSQPSVGSLAFRWMVMDEADYFGLRSWGDWSWSLLGYYVLFNGGYMAYLGAGGEFVNLMPIAAGRWYDMRLDFDVATKSYSIVVDGMQVATHVPFVGNPETLNILQIVAFSDRGCRTGYIDDVALSGVHAIAGVGRVIGGGPILESVPLGDGGQ